MLETWVDEVTVIDLEIRLLQQRLDALKKRRNSLNPLLKFPNEILEYILRLVQQAPDQDHATRQRSGHHRRHLPALSPKNWLPAAQVSRRMRSVALACAALWSTISTDYSTDAWFQLCLDRAGQHALSMTGSVRDSCEDSVARIKDHFKQTEALSLQLWDTHKFIIPAEADGDLKEILYSSEARYRSLELLNERTSSIFGLENRLFGGDCTHLKHLHLKNIRFPNVPHLPNLESLVLCEILIGLECAELRTILQQTPNLVELLIEDLCTSSPLADIDHFPENIPTFNEDSVVALPKLQGLRLIGQLVHVHQCILILSLDKSTLCITIDVTDEPEGYDNPIVYMERLPDLSRAILSKFLEFIGKAPAIFKVPLLQIEPSLDGDETVSINLHALRLRDDGRSYSSLVHVLCPIDADLSEITRTAQSIELTTAYLKRPQSKIGVLNASSLETLNLVNRSRYSFEGEVPEVTQDQFELLLADRVNHTHAPLSLVRIRYAKGPYPGRPETWLCAPSIERQNSLESKWKDARWVEQVEWIDRASLIVIKGIDSFSET